MTKKIKLRKKEKKEKTKQFNIHCVNNSFELASSLNNSKDCVVLFVKCSILTIQSKSSNREKDTNFTARQNCEHDRIKLTIVVIASRNRVAVDVDREQNDECKI